MIDTHQQQTIKSNRSAETGFPVPFAAFADELRAIVDIADELMSEGALDTVWRKAVEAGRDRLGMERCAIYRYEADAARYVGTYGTNERGQTTDEHGRTFSLEESGWLAAGNQPRTSGVRIWSVQLDTDLSHFDGERRIDGRGWVVHTPILARDGTQMAVMFNDCAISGMPLDENRQDLIAVYCSMLGGVVNQKLLEQALLEANTALEQRVARRTARLAEHAAAERVVLDITSYFMQLESTEMNRGIAYALERVGAHLNVSACQIYMLAEDGVSLCDTHAWTAAGVAQHTRTNELISFYQRFPWWREQMLSDQAIVISTIDALPAEMAPFVEWLRTGGVRAILAAPMIARGALIGELGVDIAGGQRQWTDTESMLVRMVAKAVAGALDRARIARDLLAERDSLELRVTERTQELEAVLDLSQKISATLDLGPLLDQALTSVAQIMPYKHAVIWESDTDDVYAPIRMRGQSEDVSHLANWRYDHNPDSAMRRVFETLQASVVSDVWSDSPQAQSYRSSFERVHNHPPTDIGSAMLIPLAAFGRVIGFITLTSNGRNDYDEHDARLAQALANQLAISMENARLHHRSVQTAALTERNRLARELHDSVSQALFGIVLAARTLMQSLPTGDDNLPKIGGYMLRLSEAALSEMRALIFELRPESIEKLGLVEALRKQATELCERNGLTLVVSRDSAEPALPIAAKESIYRIGMEAIQNIVKHANAKTVMLRAAVDHDTLIMELKDDGAGFDTTADHPGHMGLHNMRERTHQLGGELQVSSAAGEGATVRVRVPLNIIKSAFATRGARAA